MTGILNVLFGGNYGAKPNAPTIGTATATGTTTATVSYTAPAFDGGVPITSYTATSSPGGITGTLSTAGSGTISVSGLTSGTSYTFTVAATNAIGTGASSAASNSITAWIAPANTVAPVVSGTPTYGQTLSTTIGTWTGSPSPTYAYQWQRGGSNIGGATGGTYTLVSADVGFTIRCVVTATNAVSSVSANSNSTAAVAAVIPSAPQSVTATATSSSTATVTWTAPATGSAVVTYNISWSGGSTTSATTSVGVTGLSPSTSYTFTVSATNTAGTSAGATSNSITTPVARGCSTYTTPGTYTFTVPAGVTSISIAAVGTGGDGVEDLSTSYGGGGGATITYNDFAVSPGQTYTVCVSRAEVACSFYCVKSSYFWFSGNFCAPGYYIRGTGGVNGNQNGYGLRAKASSGGSVSLTKIYAGRGGTGGSNSNAYGNGGSGASGIFYVPCGTPTCCYSYALGGCGGSGLPNGQNGGAAANYNLSGCRFASGGGGGGGGGSAFGSTRGAGGGGTGIPYYGASFNTAGAGGANSKITGSGAVGGGGGASGNPGGSSTLNPCVTGNGGTYGGGGGGVRGTTGKGVGGTGIVRIIWPGNVRYWPNTCIYS